MTTWASTGAASAPARPFRVHVGDAVVRGRDATGLANEAVWSALERKGLIKSLFPMAVVLTPDGLAYDTGLADEILHRHAH